MGADKMAAKAAEVAGSTDPFLFLFTVFVLAVFVGFYVVWSVTPALHSPLMSVTNAISSVIIVGALIAAAGPGDLSFSKVMGFLAVALASVNIFGVHCDPAYARYVQEKRAEIGGGHEWNHDRLCLPHRVGLFYPGAPRSQFARNSTKRKRFRNCRYGDCDSDNAGGSQHP